jgi:hypothetical protein
MNIKIKTLAVVIAAASTLAVAQDQAGETSRQSYIEQVMVTAQKKSESLDDVPLSISAFTGNALTNYTSALRFLPISFFKNLLVLLSSPYPNNSDKRVNVGFCDCIK